MPLEAQWWVDDPAEQDVLAAVALGKATIADSDRRRWRWRAMVVQADPIDPVVITRTREDVRVKKDLPARARLRYERWEEGRCAQVLHLGPYADESPSIVRLHEGIAAAGYRPRAGTTRSTSVTPDAVLQRSCALSCGTRSNHSPTRRPD
jgi:hypothetical protein